MTAPHRRGRPWWWHLYPVRGTWLLARGPRAGLLRRYGIPATPRPSARGVLVTARRLADIEAAAAAVGAVVRLHDTPPHQLTLRGA